MTIPFMYHFARLVNAVILISLLAILIRKLMPDEKWASRTLWLVCLGSGMGYVTMFFHVLSDNERVAEGYPFLSIFGNPHFTLGMAIFVGIILILIEADGWINAVKAGILTLILAVVQPFMVISIIAVAGLHAAWKYYKDRRLDYRIPLLILVGGLSYLGYQFWALNTDPVLAQWTVQNRTPAPAWWDFILCISPAIMFCILAIFRRKKLTIQPHPIIIIWLISLILLTYFPFALQRRFMAGIYIPVVILAFVGITSFVSQPRLMNWLYRVAWVFSLPGTLIFVILSIYGIINHDNAYYLSKGEAQALSWLDTKGKPASLVLASPSTGLFIPTWSNDCVIYGHPFETLNLEASKQLVTSIFDGSMGDEEIDEFLQNRGVDYVFYGPREKDLGNPDFIDTLPVIFSSGDVIIYQVPQN